MKEIMKKLLFTEEDAAFMLKLNALLNQEDRSVINDLKEIFSMKNTNKTKAECTEAVTSTLDRMAESKSVHKYSLYLLFLHAMKNLKKILKGKVILLSCFMKQLTTLPAN